MRTSWASGGPKLRTRESQPAAAPEPDQARAAREGPAARELPAAGELSLAERASAISAEWAPTVGRIVLGVVFFWFGYHELAQPGGWTQYVPVVNESSSLAVILVLAHGWVLFVTAAALVAGIAPRVAAAIASDTYHPPSRNRRNLIVSSFVDVVQEWVDRLCGSCLGWIDSESNQLISRGLDVGHPIDWSWKLARLYSAMPSESDDTEGPKSRIF